MIEHRGLVARAAWHRDEYGTYGSSLSTHCSGIRSGRSRGLAFLDISCVILAPEEARGS